MKRKLRMISKFMTSQAGQQVITINILSDNSGIKVNQTMKLIQYNMRNILLENLFRKCGGEPSPTPF